mgnify:CR=1 FL=1
MDLARSRSAKKFLYALGAAACLIAASCSTSPDGQASFALSNPGLTPEADSANDGAVTETATTVDGNLPDQVAYLPGSKPASSFPEAGVAAAAGAPGAGAAAETKPDTADLSQTVATAAAPEAEKQPRAKEQILTAGPDTRTEQVLTAADPAALAPAPKKRGFLSSLFSSNQAAATPAPAAAKVKQLATASNDDDGSTEKQKKPAAPLVKLASLEPSDQSELSGSVTGSWGSDALPGVRKSALFEIKRRSGLDDDSDVDLHEEDEFPEVRVASAAGMARLAPNGLLRQTDSVDVGCLKPGLVKMLRQIEGHFGRKVVVTSGYRSPSYNRRVNGAKRSQHMYCAATDIQVAGVTKWEIANYVRSLPGRGGVGTYCHTESVHVDIGPERDWNWRCRRRKA